MNTKAEKFKAYIDKVDPKAFMVDEIKDDERHSVAFRSGIEVKGQRLPFLVLIDDSIYVMLRIFVATQVVNDGNTAAIHDFINQGNKEYKVFKFYTSDNGDIVLDICLPASDDAFDPQLVDAMIRQVAYPYLNDNLTSILEKV